MSTVQNSWQRIRQWLETHAPNVAQALPGPAGEDAIASAESEMGLQLPDSLRESYLTHDGVEYGEEELNIFPTMADAFDDMAFCLLPIETIVAEWNVWKDLIDEGEFEDTQGEPDPGIDSAWWSAGWIPVAGNGGGDFICVDMKPADGGTVGQVICAWHDMEERKLIAPSWSEYLEQLAGDMESGHLSYDEDEGVIRSDDESE